MTGLPKRSYYVYRIEYPYDFCLEGLPDLDSAVIACRYHKTWILGEAHLQDILLVVVYSLGVGLVGLPEDHAAVCRTAEQVVPAWREVHIPDGLAVSTVGGQAGLQAQAP